MPYKTITVAQGPYPTPIIEVLGNTLDAYTLANNDIANSVYICHRRDFQVTDSDVIQIPPLGAAPLATRDGTYARTNQASPVQCLLMPGIGGWVAAPSQIQASISALGLAKDTSVNNPSFGPAKDSTVAGTTSAINLLPTSGMATNSQLTSVTNPLAKDASITPLAKDSTVTGVAKDSSLGTINTTLGTPAQDSIRTAIPNNIAATGVPAINLKSTNQIASGSTITTGASLALTAVTGINQPAYNLHLTATAGASSTKPWYTVTVKWIDTASGFTVQMDAYTAFMSSVSNALSTVIAGPTDADQCQVTVTNNDSVTMTLNVAFFMLSSRTNYTSDICYQFWTQATMPAIPTFQIGASLQVPSSKIIFSVNRSVGIGVTTTPDYCMPVYSGQVFIHFDGTGSNNWDVEFTDQLTGTFIARVTHTGAPALDNVIAIFPRAPVTCHITNNGSVAGQASLEVTAV